MRPLLLCAGFLLAAGCAQSGYYTPTYIISDNSDQEGVSAEAPYHEGNDLHIDSR